MPAEPCLASWTVETFRFSSQPMTRQSQSLCLHCAIRCFSVYPESLTLTGSRESQHTWEIKANTAQRRYVTNHGCVAPVVRNCRSDCRDGPAGVNGEEAWGGDKVSRPGAHCLLLIENNKKGKCYFRSSCQGRWLKWSWGTRSIFLNRWHLPKQSKWLSHPQIPRFRPSFFPGTANSLDLPVSLTIFPARMEARKAAFWRLWQVDPKAGPSQRASLHPRLWTPLSPWPDFLKEQKSLKLRTFSPIHRSHPVDMKHVT